MDEIGKGGDGRRSSDAKGRSLGAPQIRRDQDRSTKTGVLAKAPRRQSYVREIRGEGGRGKARFVAISSRENGCPRFPLKKGRFDRRLGRLLQKLLTDEYSGSPRLKALIK